MELKQKCSVRGVESMNLQKLEMQSREWKGSKAIRHSTITHLFILWKSPYSFLQNNSET